jgi:SAM-dependent methyltransferase
MENPSALIADASFMRSRVILTAAELDYFTQLHKKPLTAKELAEEMALDPRATIRLLDCLVTFGLLEKRNGRYQVTGQGSLLSSLHPETVLPMVIHMNHLWDSWSYLTKTVRMGSSPARRAPSECEEPQRAFIGAMHVVGKMLSNEIADAFDLSPYLRLLDIGGASGSYTIAFLRKNPQMTAVLFDLEGVLPMARERLVAEGLGDRVEFVAGDFYKDELPRGCDLALLSAIIHQNSPEENLELFRKIYRALLPGGVLVVRDHIMDETRTHPSAGALFALNMLINTRGGDTYTFQEVREALQGTGFADVQLLRTGERMDCLVKARKM